jgi:hypothetical protein
MSAKIFISYRREDSAGHAGRVQDRLAREFGRDLLFMDVDGVPLGVNFVKVLQEEVAKCSVLLAVIGRDWLNVRGEDGQRRLDSPVDFVRVEIAAALQRDIPVIPILLEGTKVPRADQLPDDLRELALRNGLNVRHSSFHVDMDILIRHLKERMSKADEQGVQSRTTSADMDDSKPIRDAARSGRGVTPNLQSGQKTTGELDAYGPLNHVVSYPASGEQRAAAHRRNKAVMAEPHSASDTRRVPDDVHHIAPRVDALRLFIFAAFAIVLIGGGSLAWTGTSPRGTTTTVKPVANTAVTPRDPSTMVKPVANTAVTPRDPATTVKPVVGTASPPRDTTTIVKPVLNSAAPSDVDKTRDEINALSRKQHQLRKEFDENDAKAREAIEMIKKG